jgi:5-hydroxyisourate hydrolase
MSTLSSHVLDAALGRPAVGLAMTLGGPDSEVLATAMTDADGRVRFDLDLRPGRHRLVLETGLWFAAVDRPTFFPEVNLAFVVEPGEEHYHLAVLLSPFSYTTYRGS